MGKVALAASVGFCWSDWVATGSPLAEPSIDAGERGAGAGLVEGTV